MRSDMTKAIKNSGKGESPKKAQKRQDKVVGQAARADVGAEGVRQHRTRKPKTPNPAKVFKTFAAIAGQEGVRAFMTSLTTEQQVEAMLHPNPAEVFGRIMLGDQADTYLDPSVPSYQRMRIRYQVVRQTLQSLGLPVPDTLPMSRTRGPRDGSLKSKLVALLQQTEIHLSDPVNASIQDYLQQVQTFLTDAIQRIERRDESVRRYLQKSKGNSAQ